MKGTKTGTWFNMDSCEILFIGGSTIGSSIVPYVHRLQMATNPYPSNRVIGAAQ